MNVLNQELILAAYATKEVHADKLYCFISGTHKAVDIPEIISTDNYQVIPKQKGIKWMK